MEPAPPVRADETLTQPPVWQRRWFQVMVGVAVTLVVLSLVLPAVFGLLYAVRSVLTPVLVGLALAYVFNPVVSLMQKRGLPRPWGALVLVAAATLTMAGLLAYLIPLLVQQAVQLAEAMPGYVRVIVGWAGHDVEDLRARLRDWMESFDAAAIDFGAVFRAVGRLFDVGGGLLTGALGWASYLLIAAVVVVFCFFFFVWKWDALVTWFLPYIPASRRARVVEVVGKMDASVSAFIRGRLVQSVVVAIVLSVGWAVTDVPYWLLLGLAGAALNLVPYAAMAVWPVAVLLATVDGYAENDFSLWWDVIGASVVYLIAQSLDAYVVEPVVQGKATNLDPLTVLLVVLVGGSLAGLMGMLLAIPIAACVRIVARELVLPKMRQWAAEH